MTTYDDHSYCGDVTTSGCGKHSADCWCFSLVCGVTLGDVCRTPEKHGGRLLGPVAGPDGVAVAVWTDETDQATVRRLAAETGVPPELVDALLDSGD